MWRNGGCGLTKATVLPMLINDNRAEKMKEKMIELIGSWKRGLTWI
jgi:hypothetical protein